MGQHDPLDGFITCVQLEATAALLPRASTGPRLQQAIADFAAMTEAVDLRTTDPLGLGGLLSDAARVAQLMRGGAGFEGGGLLETLIAAAEDGLPLYAQQRDLRQLASRRLAFRELGLAIGLGAIDLLGREPEGAARPALASRVGLGEAIVSFWLDPDHRASRTWSEHREINEVMLATSLVPQGFLLLGELAVHDAA